MLTQARLHGLLSYDANTGVFTWLKSTGAVKVGDTAGTKHHSGYIRIHIDRKFYLAHRLAWLYVHGTWPKDQIDHINGVRTDNRIDNLREATRAENQQNRSIQANNTSGFPGVRWHKQARKWYAQIQHNKKQIHLGHFNTPEEAHAAYLQAKQNLHTYNPTVRHSLQTVTRPNEQ